MPDAGARTTDIDTLPAVDDLLGLFHQALDDDAEVVVVVALVAFNWSWFDGLSHLSYLIGGQDHVSCKQSEKCILAGFWLVLACFWLVSVFLKIW